MNRFYGGGDVDDLARGVGALKIEEDREIAAATAAEKLAADDYESYIYVKQTPEVRALKAEANKRWIAAIAARDALIAKKERAAAAAASSAVKTEQPRVPAARSRDPTPSAADVARFRGFGAPPAVKTEPRAAPAGSREPTPFTVANQKRLLDQQSLAISAERRPLTSDREDSWRKLVLTLQQEAADRGTDDFEKARDARPEAALLLTDKSVPAEKKRQLYGQLIVELRTRLEAGNKKAQGARDALLGELLQAAGESPEQDADYVSKLVDDASSLRTELTKKFLRLSSGLVGGGVVEFFGAEIAAFKKALAYLAAQKKSRADGAQQAAASSSAVADAVQAARAAEQAVDNFVENNPGVPRDDAAEVASEVADRAEVNIDLVVQLTSLKIYPPLLLLKQRDDDDGKGAVANKVPDRGPRVAPETFLRNLFKGADQQLFKWDAKNAQLTLTNVKSETLLRFFEVLVGPLLNYWAVPQLALAREETPGDYGEYYWIDGVVPVVTQLILALQAQRAVAQDEQEITALERAYKFVRDVAYFFVVKVATGIESVENAGDASQEISGAISLLQAFDVFNRSQTAQIAVNATRLMGSSTVGRKVNVGSDGEKQFAIGTPLATMFSVLTLQMGLALIKNPGTGAVRYESGAFVPLFTPGSAVNFAALSDPESDIHSFSSRMSRLFALPWFDALEGQLESGDSFQNVTVPKNGDYEALKTTPLGAIKDLSVQLVPTVGETRSANELRDEASRLAAEAEAKRLGTLMAQIISTERAWGVDIVDQPRLGGKYATKEAKLQYDVSVQFDKMHELLAVAFFTPYQNYGNEALVLNLEDLAIFDRYGERPTVTLPNDDVVMLRSAARPDVALVQTGATLAGFLSGAKKLAGKVRRIFKLKLSAAIQEAAKDAAKKARLYGSNYTAGIYQYASLIENTLNGRIADELDSNNEPSRTVLVPSDAALDAYFESAAYEEATRGMDADERAAYHGDVVTYHILGRRLKFDALAKSQQKLRVPTELTVYNDKTRIDVLLRAEVRVLSYDAARGGTLQVNGKVVGVGPKFTAKNGDFYIIDRVVDLERAKTMNLAAYVPATGTRKGAAAQKKPTRAQPLKKPTEDDDIPDIFEDVEDDEPSDVLGPPSALRTPPRLIRDTGARMENYMDPGEPRFRRTYEGEDVFDDQAKSDFIDEAVLDQENSELDEGELERQEELYARFPWLKDLPTYNPTRYYTDEDGVVRKLTLSAAKPSVKKQPSEKKTAAPQQGRVAAIEKAAQAQNEKDFAPMSRLLRETGVEAEVRAARAKGEHFYVLAPKGDALRSAGLDVDALDAKTLAGSEELREFARAHVVRADWSNQVSKARHHRAMMPQDMVYLLQQREGTAMKTLAKTGARAIQHVPIDVREAATAPEHEHAQLHIKDIELYRAPHRLGDDKELFVYFTKRPLVAPPTTTTKPAAAVAAKPLPKVDAESKAPTAGSSSDRWHSTVKAVEQKLQKSSDVDAYHEHVETLQTTIDSLGGAQALLEHVDQVQVDSSFAKLRQAIARNPHMDTSRKMDAHTALEQAHNRFPVLTNN